MDFKGQTFVFLGRSGAGKGDLTALLRDHLVTAGYKVLYISTGDLGRAVSQKQTLIGKWIDTILNTEGTFFPAWFPQALWLSVLIERLDDPSQILIFEGTPRHVPEAKIVDELMAHLQRPAPTPIYLEVSRQEATRRLVEVRQRKDDTPDKVASRQNAFETHVVPVIEYYGDRVVKVDGGKLQPAVLQEILAKLAAK